MIGVDEMAVTKEIRDAITRIERERLESEAHTELRKRRQADNLDLLDSLKKIIQEHPDLRFGQIITSFFIGDDPESFFYDEPSVTKEILARNINNISKI